MSNFLPHMKRILKRFLPSPLLNFLLKIKHFHRFSIGHLGSYSQYGEDVVLRSLMNQKKAGFYVDVGACHPEVGSNTKIFYDSGWCGINVDPTPNSMKAFRRQRKRDINLEMGVSSYQQEITIHRFSNPFYNTTDDQKAQELERGGLERLQDVIVKASSLEKILDEYKIADQGIDFLNIDAEGSDLDILKSINWQKYRPLFVVVELLDNPLLDFDKNKTFITLRDQGYRLERIVNKTWIFKLLGI